MEVKVQALAGGERSVPQVVSSRLVYMSSALPYK